VPVRPARAGGAHPRARSVGDVRTVGRQTAV